MDFAWTEEQERLHDEACRFAEERLNPLLAERGRQAYFSREEWRLCAEWGLVGLSIPERLGGRGLDALTVAHTVEGFSRGCHDTGLVFAVCAHLFAVAMPIAEHAGDELAAEVLPRLASGEWIGANAITEAEAGSDVFALSCRALRDGDSYRLTGEKSFVTNGPVADCLLVYASTEPKHGYMGISAFVVDADAPGVVRGEHFDKIGLTGTPVSTIRFEDCPVPESRRVGAEGAGASIFSGSMEWERACLFAQYLGVMARQLDDVVAFAKQRRQFGKPIARQQSVAHRIADMKLRLDVGRLLLHRACWMKSQGMPATLEVALSKIAVSEGAVQSGLDAIHLFGGLGVQEQSGVGWALRDAIPSRIFSGTSEIQRDLVARGLGL